MNLDLIQVTPMVDLTLITSCYLCDSSDLKIIFSTNNICLTGFFPKKDDPDPLATPITLVRCADCYNVQMVERVNPDLMFNDYWYRSSTTNSMKAHLRKHLENQPVGSLLDIGCNDGTLMKFADELGFKTVGIDPSIAVQDADEQVKNNIINDYFNSDSAEECLKKNEDKPFDLITVICTFYDVPTPVDFLRAMKRLLAVPNGRAIVEVNYAKDFFERGNVDMLGQEHLIYYFIKTFKTVCLKAGLYLNDAETNDMNGGNIVFYVSGQMGDTQRLKELEEKEKNFLATFDFNNFQSKMREEFQNFYSTLLKIRSEGKSIKILGASTRGAFIAQYMKLDSILISSAVDLQINKLDRRLPGTDIIIEHQDNHMEPDYYLVMPYQFKDEILKRYKDYMNKGNKLIFYRPIFAIYSSEVNYENIY